MKEVLSYNRFAIGIALVSLFASLAIAVIQHDDRMPGETAAASAAATAGDAGPDGR